jgi:hypothetical protein
MHVRKIILWETSGGRFKISSKKWWKEILLQLEKLRVV